MKSWRRALAVAAISGGSVLAWSVGGSFIRTAQYARAAQDVEADAAAAGRRPATWPACTRRSARRRAVGREHRGARKAGSGSARSPFDDDCSAGSSPTATATASPTCPRMRFRDRGELPSVRHRQRRHHGSRRQHRLHPHQQPRRRRRHRDDRHARRRPRDQERQGRRHRPQDRPGRRQDRGRPPHPRQVGRQRRAREGRLDHGLRQPVRLRRLDDPRHRQRAQPRPRRHPRQPLRLRELHPGRRPDQPGQQRRAAGEPPRRSRRHQHRHRVAHRRVPGHRLRHPVEPGQVRLRPAQGEGQGRPRLARRRDPRRRRPTARRSQRFGYEGTDGRARAQACSTTARSSTGSSSATSSPRSTASRSRTCPSCATRSRPPRRAPSCKHGRVPRRQEEQVTITLGEQPDDEALALRVVGSGSGDRVDFENLGLRLTAPNQQLLETYGMPDLSGGALVSAVAPARRRCGRASSGEM